MVNNKVKLLQCFAVLACMIFRFTLPAQGVVRKLAKTMMRPCSIENVRFMPSSSSLRLGAKVNVAFEYSSPEDVRIEILPMTKGEPTAHRKGSEPKEYLKGQGAAEGYFTVRKRAAIVDQVLLRMYGRQRGNLLCQKAVSAKFLFSMQILNPPSDIQLKRLIRITGIDPVEPPWWYLHSSFPVTILWKSVGYTYPTVKKITLTCRINYVYPEEGNDPAEVPCNNVYVVGTEVPTAGGSYSFVLPAELPYMGEYKVQIIGHGGVVSNSYHIGIY